MAEPVADVDFPEVDMWERMRSGFALAELNAAPIQVQLDRMERHPRDIERLLRRGEPYLFYILTRLEERGLPAELALLPVIESAFDPFAVSPAGATGIWQFMPVTAEHTGLRRDWWYDGRRDIIAATEAALDYLGELRERFDGDWLLALAAYNAGSAKIKGAIRHNHSMGQPVDFWHLPLPRETRDYVPRLLALQAIIRDPGTHGIRLPRLAYADYFSIVDTGGQIDLQVAARLAGTSVEEMQRLNPGLNRSITPPASPHTLVIPRSSERMFRERLAELPPEQRIQSVKYRIRWGDTLSAIALGYRTTVARLLQANRLDSTEITAGKLLIVPMGEPAAEIDGQLQAALM
jgi:membrane-bound lytic murein transglycosylase D